MNNFNIFKRMFINESGNRNTGQNSFGGQGQISNQQESEFDDLYQDLDSSYNYIEYPSNFNYHPNHRNINFSKFYEDLMVRKWERVQSEENVDDEECKETANALTS